MTPAIDNILAVHPAPWSHIVHPSGLVRMHDAKGAIVELFTMIEVVQDFTGLIAAQGAAPVGEGAKASL